MSTSCVFHLQVWPSLPARCDDVKDAFVRFLDEVGLSSELSVEKETLEGITVLRATSDLSGPSPFRALAAGYRRLKRSLND